jgi:hypothetical protein
LYTKEEKTGLVEIWTRYFTAPPTAVHENVGFDETVCPAVGDRSVGDPDGGAAATPAGSRPASMTRLARADATRARLERGALETMDILPDAGM